MLQQITSIFGRRPQQTTSKQASALQRVQPCLEALEDRCTPAGISLTNGTLLFEGAGQDDFGYTALVYQNGVANIRAEFRVGAGAQQTQWFRADQVAQIQFKGWGGNDDFANGTALPCWMWGGAGNDKLNGGYGQDVIYGEGGNDRLYDQSQTGTHQNWLIGGADNDYILGSNVNDQIYGGDGHDELHGQNGNDWLYGEAGNDYLYGEAGNDVLYGGIGDDLLSGFWGSDWLAGGAGNDTIYGGAHNDHIHYDPADAIREFYANEGDVWWV